jgi:F0F1-type ATP synthase assembly protein I
MTVYNASAAKWAGELYGVANTIAKFIQGMYVGILKTFLMDVSFANLLTPIPAVIVCTVGYILGVKYCNGVKKAKEKSEKADRYYPNIADIQNVRRKK